MSSVVTPPAAALDRSPADRCARRVLCLPVDAPPARLIGAHGVVSRSIAISAVRCLLTYIVVPVIGPLVGLWDSVGPQVGIALALISFVALAAGVRRFFAADHRWRWRYAGLAAAVAVFVAVQLVIDVSALSG